MQFRTMMDWLSIVSIILWLAPFDILRQAPMIGPMVVAVVDTIKSQDVLLYMFIFLFFLLLFSMSFQIAYGTELDQFTQIDTALYALFKMPFAEEWQNLDTPKARSLTTIYWILFLILSVLLLNLLIAIVTQVYPKKLALSEDVWKATITENMQLQLRLKKQNDNQRERRKRRKRGLGEGEEHQITLAECLNNKLILEGFDGYNFWRSSSDNGGNGAVDIDDSTDQEEHIFNEDQDDGMLGGSDDSLLANLSAVGGNRDALAQLMAVARGSGNVGGEAWQKM